MSIERETRRGAAGRKALFLIVTCEHGGNRIPRAYASLFNGRRRMLSSHRGYDAGALAMARSLARAFGATLITSSISRLLVDLNRSAGHPTMYSSAVREAPESVRTEVYRRYYVPYRSRVENAITSAIARGERVLHISSHSFAPRRSGVVRRADVGLLYDPGRAGERSLCARWGAALRSRTHWRVRRNYPYRGTSDGLTRYLRTKFPDWIYSGIELEVNQRRTRGSKDAWTSSRAMIVQAFADALGTGGSRNPRHPLNIKMPGGPR
jgi:predicted N-formylglutamate amidohydrolase